MPMVRNIHAASVQGRTLAAGSFFTAAEYDDRAAVVVLGANTATTAFGDPNAAVGATVTLGSASFRVVGVLEAAGSGFMGSGDDMAVLPMTSYTDRLAYGGTFEDVLACAKNGERLFDGRQDAAFAPFAVRRNLREREDYALRMERRADDTRLVEGPEIEQIVVRDVLADSDERARARGGARRSARARAVSAARPATPEADEAPVKDDDPSMGM